MNGPRIGSLCSGYGGLEEGLRSVVGGSVAWHAENDPAPSRVLTARFPDVPNYGDLTATDWTQVEPVDWLTAGYPCQPFSHAGKRKGKDDERHLWPFVADAVRVLRPRCLLFENVAGHVSLGLDAVLADLAALGYLGAWGVLRASDAGAPHGRARIFIVASDASGERHGCGEEPGCLGRLDGQDAGGAWERQRSREVAVDRGAAAPAYTGCLPGNARRLAVSGEAAGGRSHGVVAGRGRAHALADSSCDGWDEGWPEPAGVVGGSDAAIGGDAPTDSQRGGRDGWSSVAQRVTFGRTSAARSSEEPCVCGTGFTCLASHADGRGCEVGAELDSDSPSPAADWSACGEHADGPAGAIAWGGYAPAVRRWERVLGRCAPRPTEPGSRSAERLSPRFVEWLMGLPDGWVTDVPDLSRNSQLKILGNGVVPAQAALAVRTLIPLLEAEAVAA